MAILDRVKFDGPPDILVWKWPSESLSLGAQLIVNESQEAIFYKGGQALDLFTAGTHTLSSGNLPFLSKLINLPFGGKTPFAAEVYFVSTAVALGHDWGTKTPFMILDPRYGISIPLRAYGQFGLRVTNARELVIQIAGASGGGTRKSVGDHIGAATFTNTVAPVSQGGNFNPIATNANDLAMNLLESLVLTSVQQAIGSRLQTQRCSVLDLPTQLVDLSALTRAILENSYQTFGVQLVNFTLESINFDAKDDSVVQLRSMLAEAARLSVVGDAFRRNEDFYRADRQMNILQSAAESGGAAGAVMGAAMGVGMGFGTAPAATALAREAMSPAGGPNCSKCGSPMANNARFCGECGTPSAPSGRICPACNAQADDRAKFCGACGGPLTAATCRKCGAVIQANAKFCAECGEKA